MVNPFITAKKDFHENKIVIISEKKKRGVTEELFTEYFWNAVCIVFLNSDCG